MREDYQRILKSTFHKYLLQASSKPHMTHARMANMLAMGERSYVELDHGNSCCGALTLVRFQLYCCEDLEAFLEELRTAFEQEERDGH